jgi:uncharacterized membrane protein
MALGLKQAFLIGITAGMRCFLAPAVVVSKESACGSGLKIATAAAAVAELVADKTPYIGSRLDAGPLTGRVVAGAICGARVAANNRASAPAGFVIGGIAAFASAHLFYHLRRRSAHSGIPDLAFALVEDAAAAGIASRACK